MTADAVSRLGGSASWVLVAVLVWAVLLGVVCVRTVAQPEAHDCYKPFYEPAGRNWLNGEELYQLKSATCRYSPLVNALFAPLALMPTLAGGLTWRAVNAAAFLGGLFWWLHVYAPPTWTRSHRALVFLLVVPLAIPTINCAQANPLLTGLMLAGTAAAGQERWNWAAALVAGACLLKVYPIALALLLVVTFPRPFLPRFLVAMAAGLLLPFAMQHPWWVARQYGNWWTSLCIDDRTDWPLEKCYRDGWMIIRFYHLPVTYHGYILFQLAAAAATAAVSMAARWWAARPAKEVLNAVMGMAACWMTVCGPTTEGGGYILLAPTLAWALLQSWHHPWPLWVRGILLASCASFTGAVVIAMGPNAGALMAYGWHPIGGLLLLLALMGESIRRIVTRPPEGVGAAPVVSARAA